MRITWHERLHKQPHLRDFKQWPIIPLDTQSSKLRKHFLRNQQVITQVLDGKSLGDIARTFNLSQGRISQLLNHVLGGDTE